MLDPASWLPSAEGLAVGRSIRVDHTCGPGRTLKVHRDADRLSAFCFRCNEHGAAAAPQEPITVRIARLAAVRAADVQMREVQPGRLPEPHVSCVGEWPEHARLWLFKAGLGRAEIGRLGAYYHPPSDRVVLPVLDPATGIPVFYQARAVQRGRAPKYMAPTTGRDLALARWGHSDVPTLTEDILSAFKVGLVSEGIAVLGTHLSPVVLAHLMGRRCSVNLWLDPDPAGQRAAGKIAKQLRAYGIQYRTILSQRDPKLHTKQEIKELLCPST